jgi:hypothetical protein
VSRQLQNRLRIKLVLAVLSLALSILTAISAEWIEELTGFEPDAGSGAMEWMIALGFGVAAITLALFARRDVRALRAAVT